MGDVSLAEEMIAAASESGANVVKFQYWDPLYLKATFISPFKQEILVDKVSKSPKPPSPTGIATSSWVHSVVVTSPV